MVDVFGREIIYLWYYFSVQLEQIFWYWVLGMVLGSTISVFAKDCIHSALHVLQRNQLGILEIVVASAIGIASPLCMYGTIPIAASFSRKGIKDDWLAAFMITSPATKIINLGAMKIVLGRKRFLLYLVFVILFSFLTGSFINILIC